MKKFLKSYGIAVYWFILLADLLLIYFKIEEPRWITKLLLMPFLAYLLVISTTKSHLNSRDKYFYAALFFAWLGDFCLLFSHSNAFLGGMLAFFIMQLLYIYYFYRVKPVLKSKLQYFIITWIVCVIVGVFAFRISLPGLQKDKLVIPVAIYMLALITAVAFAANILISKSRGTLALRFFLPGMLLFFISDAVLALNKFVYQEHFLNIVVMLTYGYAQLQLMLGNRKLLKVAHHHSHSHHTPRMSKEM